MRQSMFIGLTVGLLAAIIVIMAALSANYRAVPRQGWACPSGYVMVSGTGVNSAVCVLGVTPHTTLIPSVETTPKP